jgi:hypothetical protein
MRHSGRDADLSSCQVRKCHQKRRERSAELPRSQSAHKSHRVHFLRVRSVLSGPQILSDSPQMTSALSVPLCGRVSTLSPVWSHNLAYVSMRGVLKAARRSGFIGPDMQGKQKAKYQVSLIHREAGDFLL